MSLKTICENTYTTVNQETLETAHALLDEGLEVTGIAGDDAAVEADINPALVLGSLDFFFQRSHRGGGWDGIEGHVNHSSDAAKGSGLGAGVETLPFRAARLIQVDMGVHQTRQQDMG